MDQIVTWPAPALVILAVFVFNKEALLVGLAIQEVSIVLLEVRIND